LLTLLLFTTCKETLLSSSDKTNTTDVIKSPFSFI